MSVDNKSIVECVECGVVGEGFLLDLELRGWEFIEADNGFSESSYWLCPKCSSI